MSTEDIMAAIASSHQADLVNIRLYIAWIKIRRRVNRRFYFQAHWITESNRRAHWINQREGR